MDKLVSVFCRTKDTSYLDKMDPKVVQLFYDIVDRNIDKLRKNKIAKIVQIYVKTRTKEELQTVENTTDMNYLHNILPKILPIVLETLLISMIGIEQYTEKQLAIYKYAQSIIRSEKIVKNASLNHYAYFGHGWTIEGTIDLRKYKRNITVIALQDPLLLYEKSVFDHMAFLKKSSSIEEYYRYIAGYAELTHNAFGVYSSQSDYNMIPNMLLTLLQKNIEFTGLINIATHKMISPQIRISKLSDLIDVLSKYDSEDIFLIVFTCRSPLTKEQINYLQEGSLSEVAKYIKSYGIKEVEIGSVQPSLSFNDFQTKEDIENVKRRVQEIEDEIITKQKKEMETLVVKPLQMKIGSYSWLMKMKRAGKTQAEIDGLIVEENTKMAGNSIENLVVRML